MQKLIAIFLLFASVNLSANTELVVYTHRNEQLIKPLFDAYEKETKVKIKYITGEPGALLERIKAEGATGPADILITVDAGSLWQADEAGVLSPVDSKVLTSKIPSYYRSPDNKWFGLSLRARTIFYNPNVVKASDLKSYEDLSDAKWKGKLCLRTSKKVYNQSLVATLIAKNGEEKTKGVVQGWVNNLGHEVFDNDTKLLEAIDSGKCGVGIANTYYLGRMQKDGKAKNVSVFFPKDTHMNVSGGAVLNSSKKKAEAVRFLEWLTSDAAQKMFADSNMEYPVVKNVSPVDIVKAWGTPSSDTTPLAKAGELQKNAMKIMDQVKYK